MRNWLTKAACPGGDCVIGTKSIILSLLLISGSSHAQLSIENHTSSQVPEQRAWVIYQSTCQVVAEQFHVKNPAELQVPVKLTVGSSESRVLYDEGAGLFEIQLKGWSDTEFAFASLRLTLQQLVSSRTRRDLLFESLARAQRKLPLRVTKNLPAK